MSASTLDLSHVPDARALPTVPILPLGGAGAFDLTLDGEGGPIDRMNGTMCLLRAVRDQDVWTLDWRGPEESMVLARLGRPVWRCTIPGSGSVFSLRQLPEFKAILEQFEQHNRAFRSAGAGGWLAKAAAELRARLSSPRATVILLWKLLKQALKLVLMIMGAVLAVTLWLQHTPVTTAATTVGPATSAPTAAPVGHQAGTLPAELRDRTLGESLSPTEMAVVANITREVGVQLRPAGQPFVIFSDPNCPSCKDLEQKLAQVDPRFVPVIVPVAFKDGSEAAVRRVLCAKDTAAAWSAEIGAAAGDTALANGDGSCAGAAEKVTKANGAFVALNFSGTPTIVSATGKVVAGSGPVETINRWLDANGGLPLSTNVPSAPASAAPAPATAPASTK